jgi:mannose-6-phosphate isomerase-like protein (cupin superfamily)
MFTAFNLPRTFDVARLRADLTRAEAADWVPHFNRGYYEGDWSALPLRSVGGETRRIYPAPVPIEEYADTPHLARFPYFREVLTAFPMPLRTVRLLRLGPGSRILEHKDEFLGYEDGQVRFHIPIVTSPLVEFIVAGRRLDMNPGEAWYIDFNHPHSVRNQADIDRVHLVIDGFVNPWVDEVFAEASARPVG